MKASAGTGIRPAVGVGLVMGLVFVAAAAWASPPQDMGECDVPHFDEMRWNTVTTMTGENRILHFQKPTIRCPGGTTIRSDSVRVYEATKYYQLYGNVEFTDTDSRLTSDQAQYFSEQRRLSTVGNSVLTNLVDGSVVTGHAMTLIRGETEEDDDHLTVQGGQPHATLYPAIQPVEDVEEVSEGEEAEGPPDLEGMPPDSLMAAPDPGDAAQDSAGVVLDTLGLNPATPAIGPDTVGVQDSLPALPDSAVSAPETPIRDPVLPVPTPAPAGSRAAAAAVAAGVVAAAAGIPYVGPGIAGIASGVTAVAVRIAAIASGTSTPPDSTGMALDSPGPEPEPAATARDTLIAAPDSALAPSNPVAAAPDSSSAGPDPETPPEAVVVEEPAERIPYEIDARRFVIEGSESFRAIGNVVVTRDSLNATADSLDYAQAEGALFLSGNALVVTVDYALTADDIRLAVPQDEIREARASGDAVLEGQDLQLVSPIVTLFFTDGVLDRLVAVRDPALDSAWAEMDDEARDQERLRRGAPPLAVRELGFSEFPDRPYALAQNFALDGDSLEVLAPGEIIDEVRAIGNARGESMGQDSLNTEETPEIISSDWLEGDTIIAFFVEKADSLASGEGGEFELADDPEAPPPDLERGEQQGAELEPDSTEAQYQLEHLVARGNARSMYRMAPSDSTAAEEPGRFAVHYVVGDEITILLNEAGEAEHMEVVGQTRGIHLEPLGGRQNMIDSTAVPDTAALGVAGMGVRPDTIGVGPDTTRAGPDTTVVGPDTTAADPDTSFVAVGSSGSSSRGEPVWLRPGRRKAAGGGGRGGSVG